jgi:hypothetical protein
VTTSDWVTSAIALAAFAVSALTAYATWRWRVIDRRGAGMTVYFHRNSEMAKVHVGEETIPVGYNLVLWNRGPGVAREISAAAYNAEGVLLQLVDVEDHEFPLSVLEAGARYPIPWLLERKEQGRHFRCTVAWTDGNGRHEATLPLRRGETRL